MKPCKQKKYIEMRHNTKKYKPVEYFKKLCDDHEAKKTVLEVANNKMSKISDGSGKKITKAGKPHNIGETVILPAVSIIISSVMKQSASKISKSIQMSNSYVSRRFDVLAEDVEKQLVANL